MVGKNYRLQNIQLSKINSGASPPKPPGSVARGNPYVPLRSLAWRFLAAKNLFAIKFADNVRSAVGTPVKQRSKRPERTSASERPTGLIAPPKLFTDQIRLRAAR